MALYTQTVEQLKRDIALAHGGMVYYGTADSATASTIVHDELKRFTQDDALNGKEVDCVGGTNAGEALDVSGFTALSGTMAVVPNFTTTPDATTRYHVYDPSIVTKRLLDTLIAEAVRAIGRQRFVATVSRKLILNDLLSGIGDMETFTVATLPDGWAAGGTGGTGSQQTTTSDPNLVRTGSGSAKLVSDGTNACDFYASAEPYSQFDGHYVTAKVWVWTATASRVLVNLIDGVATVASSYHTGGSIWEELTASKTLDDPVRVREQLRIASGAAVTAYFDHARIIDDEDIWEYTLPSGLAAISRIFVEGDVENEFTHIEIPAHLYSIDRSGNKLIIHRDKFSGYGGRRLLIQGLGSLTAPTTDASTVEVPEAVKAYVNYELLARRRGVAAEQLEFAKRRRDEEFALARRIPSSRNLKWIER